MNGIPFSFILALSIALFAIGLCGVMVRRNILLILMSVEIMLNAGNLLIVGMAQLIGDISGQILVFFAMIVAAVEVSVGLGIFVLVYRHFRSTNMDQFSELKG